MGRGERSQSKSLDKTHANNTYSPDSPADTSSISMKATKPRYQNTCKYCILFRQLQRHTSRISIKGIKSTHKQYKYRYYNLPASQLASQLASQRHTAARQPVSEPTSQPLSQPASQPATQPASQQMTSHQLGIQLASQPGSQPAASQPASQPASQLASQPQHLNQGYKISPKIIANILHKYFILSTQKAYKYYIPPKHLAATEALFQSRS